MVLNPRNDAKIELIRRVSLIVSAADSFFLSPPQYLSFLITTRLFLFDIYRSFSTHSIDPSIDQSTLVSLLSRKGLLASDSQRIVPNLLIVRNQSQLSYTVHSAQQ